MIGVDATLPILIADDDADDCLLAREALIEAGLANPVHTVEDGERLLDYLHRRGAYAAPAAAPRPGLILLDLNMPRMGGLEALRALRADPALRAIPVVVLSTSAAGADRRGVEDLGACAYLTKPDSFAGLVALMQALGRAWPRANASARGEG